METDFYNGGEKKERNKTGIVGTQIVQELLKARTI